MYSNNTVSVDADTLLSTFIFSGYSREELISLLSETKRDVRTYAKGEVIFSPQSFRRELGVVLSGRVLVTKGELTVSELVRGDIFGAAALFNDEERYVSTLTARTRCTALFLAQETVRELITREEKVRVNYVRYLSNRIRFLSDKIDALTQVGGRQRLSSYLLSNADENGCVRTGCSMTELSSRLHIGRATLYRELSKLEETGVLARTGRTITILKPEELSRAAD